MSLRRCSPTDHLARANLKHKRPRQRRYLSKSPTPEVNRLTPVSTSVIINGVRVHPTRATRRVPEPELRPGLRAKIQCWRAGRRPQSSRSSPDRPGMFERQTVDFAQHPARAAFGGFFTARIRSLISSCRSFAPAVLLVSSFTAIQCCVRCRTPGDGRELIFA